MVVKVGVSVLVSLDITNTVLDWLDQELEVSWLSSQSHGGQDIPLSEHATDKLARLHSVLK